MTTAILRLEQQKSEIIDFAVGRDVLTSDELLMQASIFINKRKKEKGRLLSRVISATIEEGLTYEYMFNYCKKTGISWENWVKEGTPYDPDTARHYRNVATKFKTLIEAQPDSVIDRVKLSALYKLAVQDVPVSSAITYFQLLTNHDTLKGDVKLATIAKDPEIASRVDNQELTIPRAYDLTVALKTVNPYIDEMCRDEKVSEAGVVTFLNRVFLDYCRAGDDKRPDKTWAEIVNNGNRLVWTDKAGSYDIPLSEAQEGDCRLYMQYRQNTHIFENTIGDEYQSRATAKVTRSKEGHLILTLLDGSALPPDFETGTILIDLLPDTLTID